MLKLHITYIDHKCSKKGQLEKTKCIWGIGRGCMTHTCSYSYNSTEFALCHYQLSDDILESQFGEPGICFSNKDNRLTFSDIRCERLSVRLYSTVDIPITPKYTRERKKKQDHKKCM